MSFLSVTSRSCSIPPGLPIEIHRVLVASEASLSAPWSSSGDVGRRYGRNRGQKVTTNHDKMLARAARSISGSWPRIVQRWLLLSIFNCWYYYFYASASPWPAGEIRSSRELQNLLLFPTYILCRKAAPLISLTKTHLADSPLDLPLYCGGSHH